MTPRQREVLQRAHDKGGDLPGPGRTAMAARLRGGRKEDGR